MLRNWLGSGQQGRDGLFETGPSQWHVTDDRDWPHTPGDGKRDTANLNVNDRLAVSRLLQGQDENG